MKNVVHRTARFILNRLTAAKTDELPIEPFLQSLREVQPDTYRRTAILDIDVAKDHEGVIINLFTKDRTIIEVTIRESRMVTEKVWMRHLDYLYANRERLDLTEDTVARVDNEIKKIYDLELEEFENA